MSTAPTIPAEFSQIEERRRHGRRRLSRVTYIHLDRDNGGILLDIGEGGVNFQGVAGLMEGTPCALTFTLPGMAHRFELRGEIAWANDSRKGGGIRFVELPDEVRLPLKNWLSTPSEQDAPAQPVLSHASHTQAESPAATAASVKTPLEAARFEETRVEGRTQLNSLFGSEVEPAVRNATQPDLRVDAHEARSADGAPMFQPLDYGVRQDVPVSSSHRNSRIYETFMILADLCLLAFAIGIAVSRFPGPFASILGAHTSGSERASMVMNGTVSNFHVDVRDISNRRWVLSNDLGMLSTGNGPSNGPSNMAAARTEAPARLTPAPPAVSAKSTSPAPSRSVALGLPFLRQPAEHNLDAPVLAEDSEGSRVFLTRPSAPEPAAPPAEARPPARSGPAVLIYKVDPQYPREAALAHLTGAVRVSLNIGRDGVPFAVTALSGDPRLAAAAIDAVRQWRYNPALLDGKAAESQIVVTLNFQFQ